MSVNEAELDFFKNLQSKSHGYDNLSIEDSRNNVASIFMIAKKSNVLPHIDGLAPARDGYQIPFTIYNNSLPDDSPMFIYYMGNGYIYDLYKVNSLVCSRIAENANAKIVIINMRLAPENPLPISIYDAYDATKYIFNTTELFKFDRNKLAIGGFCTGATCALAIAYEAYKSKDFVIDYIILLNGLYDLCHTYNDYNEYEKEDISFSSNLLNYVINQQNLEQSEYKNTLYSPIYHENFDHLPYVSLIVAEYDRNRSSSEAFQAKLEKHNVEHMKIILKGQVHNTIVFCKVTYDHEDPACVIAQLLNDRNDKKLCGAVYNDEAKSS